MNYNEPNNGLDVLRTFADTIWGKENLWDDCHFILTDVPLNKREMEKFMPRGLRLSDPPTATIFVVDYKNPSFTVPYKEAALLAHVTTPIGPGVHCPWMIVDDDTAMIYGRELLGYPKKMGVFDFVENDEGIKVSLTRRGVKVLDIEGKRGAAETNPAPVLARKTFNAGGPGQMFLTNLLWLFRPTEVIHESYEAEIKMTVNESENDPIARFIDGEPTNGRIVILDIPDGKYIVPVGLAGLLHMGRTFPLRFR